MTGFLLPKKALGSLVMLDTVMATMADLTTDERFTDTVVASFNAHHLGIIVACRRIQPYVSTVAMVVTSNGAVGWHATIDFNAEA